jgi:hypothetical protein
MVGDPSVIGSLYANAFYGIEKHKLPMADQVGGFLPICGTLFPGAVASLS